MAKRTYPSTCGQCSRPINPGDPVTEIQRSTATRTFKPNRVGVDQTALGAKRIIICNSCTHLWIIGQLGSEKLLINEADRNWYEFLREDVTRD